MTPTEPSPPTAGVMPPADERIPGQLNLVIAAAQIGGLLALLAWAGTAHSGWAIAAACVAYSLLMNSAYAMLHEAEHGMLHAHRGTNETMGAVLALFFPAPFHLLRQGHIGHHLRNRSDDEAFDFHFEGESRLWKTLQFYGILTGCFYVCVVLSNLIALICPGVLKAKWAEFDRPTQALLDSLNPRYMRLIRVEALAGILLHLGWGWLWHVKVWPYAACFLSFGVLWSGLQYVHHYGTERDVLKGARNLKSWRWLDLLWLNHNWHRNHHAKPTTPWTRLPKAGSEGDGERGHLLTAYLNQWRGPRPTTEHVQNRFAGKIIR